MEHRVCVNGVFFLFPNDELYQRYKEETAFIDVFGRLVDAKTHRVIKELIPIPGEEENIQGREPSDQVAARKENIRDRVRESVTNEAMIIIDDLVQRGLEWFVYDITIPAFQRFWHEKAAPFGEAVKDALLSKETKAERIIRSAQKQRDTTIVKAMSQEEIELEKAKAICCWFGLLDSLINLENAGEIDMKEVLSQLADPVRIQQVNELISRNHELIKEDRMHMLQAAIQRPLFEGDVFVPIQVSEVEALVKV